jgi:hypothetical protein
MVWVGPAEYVSTCSIRGVLACLQDGGGERISRRVGELISERIGGRGPDGPQALNDLDPYPDRLRLRRRGDRIPAPLVTHHYPGPALEPSRSEARRRHLCLVPSLGNPIALASPWP